MAQPGRKPQGRAVVRRAWSRGVFAACVLVSVPAAWGQANESKWRDADYARFTAARFRSYRPAVQGIDFANIDSPLLSAALFYETNLRRTKHHLRPFRYSPALRRAAVLHSRDMVEKDFHGHINPDDPKRRTLAQRLAQVGLIRCAMAENVAFFPGRRYRITKWEPGGGQIEIVPGKPPASHTYVSFARLVLDGWMRSRSHRRNILDKSLTYLGCGAVHCRKELLGARGEVVKVDYFKATQNFASRRGPDPGK
jgi:uncharacterized protein YkwD